MTDDIVHHTLQFAYRTAHSGRNILNNLIREHDAVRGGLLSHNCHARFRIRLADIHRHAAREPALETFGNVWNSDRRPIG